MGARAAAGDNFQRKPSVFKRFHNIGKKRHLFPIDAPAFGVILDMLDPAGIGLHAAVGENFALRQIGGEGDDLRRIIAAGTLHADINID